MLKIKLVFNVSIDIKKKNNKIKLLFYSNVKKMSLFLNKNCKKFIVGFFFKKNKLRRNLMTVLKSPFHYKITKLNISENFKKLYIIFSIKNVDLGDKYVIFEENGVKNIFPSFNYFYLYKMSVKFNTKI